MADTLQFNATRAFDVNGNAVAGAEAFFYLSGTTTPVTVYADSDETAAHPVPLVADASGTFPLVFSSGTAAIKVVVTDSAGANLDGYPIDPVVAVPVAGQGAGAISFAPSANNSATNVQDAIDLVSKGYRYLKTVFLTSGVAATYTPSAGCIAFRISRMVGGGGGGASAEGTTGSVSIGIGGDGAAGLVSPLITNLDQTFTYTVGAGGTGGASGALNAGTDGGDTTFSGSTGLSFTAEGGKGALAPIRSSGIIDAKPNFADVATATGGDQNYNGQKATPAFGFLNNAISASIGGSSLMGLGGMGGGHRAAGQQGVGYGAGGGAACVNAIGASFAGADGTGGAIEIVEYF